MTNKNSHHTPNNDSAVTPEEPPSWGESVIVADGFLRFTTSHADAVAFRLSGRMGIVIDVEIAPGQRGAEIELRQIGHLGTYDIHTLDEAGKKHRFGADVAKASPVAVERILDTFEFPLRGKSVYGAIYLTHGRNGVSIRTDQDAKLIAKYVYGFRDVGISDFEVDEGRLRLTGEFKYDPIPGTDVTFAVLAHDRKLEDDQIDRLCEFEFTESDDRIEFCGSLDLSEDKFELMGSLSLYAYAFFDDGDFIRKRIGVKKASLDKSLDFPSNREIIIAADDGPISIRQVKRDVSPKTVTVESVSISRNGFTAEGAIEFYTSIDENVSVSVLCREEVSERSIELPCVISRVNADDDAMMSTYSFVAHVDIGKIVSADLLAVGNVKFSIKIEFADGEYTDRLRLCSIRNSHLEAQRIAAFSQYIEAKDICVYVERRGYGIGLILRDQLPEDGIMGRIKEKIAIYLDRIIPRYKDDIWLLYETNCDTYQDNSFYLFKWLIDSGVDEKPYFIVKNARKTSVERLYREKFVEYFSIKHLLLIIRASKLVSAQGRHHCYKLRPIYSRFTEIVNSKKFVFLQHGVTAFKRSKFHRDDRSGGADLVFCTSKEEKVRIQKHWGYHPKDVIDAGFSRFDVLEDSSASNDKKHVVIMPTWRNALEHANEDEFEASLFYQSYREILEILSESDANLKITLIVHIKIKKLFRDNFENVDVQYAGDVSINKIIMNANLLITDYSSVAWDMAYMKKPVLFFQFDREEYLENTGAFVDFETDLFGPAYDNAAACAEGALKQIASPSVPFEPEELFSNVDQRNSERIYAAIKAKKFK